MEVEIGIAALEGEEGEDVESVGGELSTILEEGDLSRGA